VAELGEIKKEVFFRLLELAGRVYIVVRYSDEVRIGMRGFSEEERQGGLVLVFNRGMQFAWEPSGIKASLVFGSSIEKCFIPEEDIVAVYSPELGVQLALLPEEARTEQRGPGGHGREGAEKPFEERVSSKAGNIIKVDFRKGAASANGEGGVG
jgi:hypothetical protein